MALILKRPYSAVALKQKFMRKKESYEEIFSERDNLLIWPVIAQLMRKTDEYMSNLRQNGSGERFLRNVRYLVSFLTVSRLLGTFAYSSNSLISLDLSKYTFDEVKRTWEDNKLPRCKHSNTTGVFASCFAGAGYSPQPRYARC